MYASTFNNTLLTFNNTHRLDTVQRQRELMQEELKRSTQKMLSAEERAQEMDGLLTEEEVKVQQLEKDIEKMREKQVCLQNSS